MMDDLISRQAAIDELQAKKDKSAKGDIGCFYNAIIQNDIDALKALPSAQPERKKGHWIVVTRHEHYPSGKPYEKLQCPFCKKFDHNGDGFFCGYCGAEMQRGENDG